MEEKREEAELCSRRNILKGSTLLLMGGIAGGISNACSAPVPTPTTAPPLPWKWVKLDPPEAGRRSGRCALRRNSHNTKVLQTSGPISCILTSKH
jgi:hypothetical protein